MFRLIETIRLSNGQFNNLGYHEQRMNKAMREIFGVDRNVRLEEMLNAHVKPSTGLYKCRLSYNNKMHEVEFSLYTIRPVRSLKIVRDDSITYDHKFEDRKEIERNFGKRGDCDDVLFVKQDRVTDSSQANLVFRKGTVWSTPVSCLLPGTMRQSLLEAKSIREEEININELSRFESFKLVNAMLLFDAPESAIENIVP